MYVLGSCRWHIRTLIHNFSISFLASCWMWISYSLCYSRRTLVFLSRVGYLDVHSRVHFLAIFASAFQGEVKEAFRSPVAGIPFQVESDNKKNFSTDKHFHAFSKQRYRFVIWIRLFDIFCNFFSNVNTNWRLMAKFINLMEMWLQNTGF